jgi:hypothetical protein
MPGSTGLGIVYPVSTDTVHLTDDLKTMADGIDSLIDTDRDARDAAYALYSAVLTGATSGTWTAGTATVSTYWSRDGRRIFVDGRITFGSTTSITSLSGAMQISLPVTAAARMDSRVVGTGLVVDNSPSTRYPMHCVMSGTGNILMVKSADGALMIGGSGGSQSPITTFAQNDEIRYSVVYEAAAA